MKKFVLGITCVFALLLGGKVVLAEEHDIFVSDGIEIISDVEIDSEVTEQNIENVGVIIPEATRGADIPTSNWNISSKGKYSLSGSSNRGGYVYSSYTFNGKTSYTISIENTGSNVIDVKCKNSSTTYVSFSVNAGKTRTITFNGIKSTTAWYASFYNGNLIHNSYEFKGTIN